MSITVPHQKELLGVSYATAVAASAGVVISKCIFHDYGTDLTFSPVSTLPNGKRQCTGFDYHFQLKSTVDFKIVGDTVVYELEADAYNLFAYWTGPSPCYLLLMCLPREFNEWVSITEDLVELRKCCYWEYIPPGTPTQNNRS